MFHVHSPDRNGNTGQPMLWQVGAGGQRVEPGRGWVGAHTATAGTRLAALRLEAAVARRLSPHALPTAPPRSQVLDALAEVAFEPEFLPSRIEKERKAVVAEAQMMNTIE